MRSTTGETMRQGPHHGAHKSTSTGSEEVISSSKLSVSASTIHGSGAWQTLHRGTPRGRGRTRFFLAQLGHVMVVALVVISEPHS